MTAEEYITEKGFANWYTEHPDGSGEVVINYQDCLEAMIGFTRYHLEEQRKINPLCVERAYPIENIV